MRWQNAVITRIEKRSPSVSSFFFRLSEPFAFRPGQHVTVKLTAPDGYTAQRSYSLASSPGSNRTQDIELVIERLEGGEVSPFFHEVAEVGDEIELGGPIGGHFVWQPEKDGAALFIGGGSGVVPFMSMLRYRTATASKVPVTLVFSARRRSDLLFLDELSALADRQDGFTLKIALTRESQPHPFRAGRIDADFIRSAVGSMTAPLQNVLICGSNPFVETAAVGVLAAGVEAAHVKTERYGI